MVRRFETFIIYINQIYRCVQKIKSREMMELGLKGTDVMCLFNLMRSDDGLTSAQRYRSKLKLSDNGRRAAEKMEILIENAVVKGGEGLTEQERAVFYKALETISRNLQNVCGEEGE